MELLLALLFTLPDPGIPPVPLNVAPAAEMRRRLNRTWRNMPLRQTMAWTQGGIKWCDDPDCSMCAEHVYGSVGAWQRR